METFKASGGAKNMRRQTCSKWHWVHKEDERLTSLVKIYGPGNWKHIAGYMQGRTGKSCRLRWVNQLNPNINKRPFTNEEQQRLLELHHQHGNKWSTIVRFFPGRTDNQLKNQYHILVGTRYMNATSPSRSTDACGIVSGGSTNPCHYRALKSLQTDPQLSEDSVGKHGVPPPIDVPGGTWMRLLTEGLSSLYDGEETWFAEGHQISDMVDCLPLDSTNFGTVCANLRTNNGDSMISIANPTAISKFGPTHPMKAEEGVGVFEFIDFMGIGN